jgi:G3E family GTPase
MVKIDLITGFLGSGKTNFIRKYVKYLESQGERICIIENDHGSINVDLLLLNDLKSPKVDIEMVACACGKDKSSHLRRYRSKLITVAMLGYNRVIVEPSGIYDVDEFFDSLYEAPLDTFYTIGNVITIVDATLDDNLSKDSNYILGSQISFAGAVLLSRVQELENREEGVKKVTAHVKQALTDIHCPKNLDNVLISKVWDEFTNEDLEKLRNCGYERSSFEKMPVIRENEYKSYFFYRFKSSKEEFINIVKKMFADESAGNIIRIKGLVQAGDKWVEVNATRREIKVNELVTDGQEVIIVIGEKMNKDVIVSYFPGSTHV